MYETTEKFNEAILGDTRKFYARIKSSDIETIDTIKSIKQFSQLSGNGYITAGGAVSSYVILELWEPEFSLENNELLVEIGIETDDGTVEWCPLGYYTAEKPKKSIDGLITVTAYDRIQTKFSEAFFSKLTYPTNAINVLNEISQNTGISIDTSNLENGVIINQRKVVSSNELDSAGNVVEKVTYENPFNGYTYKETLGYIAMLYCKYAVAGRDGSIKFKWYQEVSDYVITSDVFYDDLETNELTFSVTSITCNTGDEKLKAGTGTSNIQLENPVMTQERLDYIYEQVKLLSFIPMQFSFYGDVRIELCDVVKMEKSDGTVCSVPIMNASQDFDGGLKTTVQSYGGTEQEGSTKSPLLNRLNRQYEELLLIKTLIGEKASFESLNVVYGEFKTLKADYGEYKKLVTDEFEAKTAEITAISGDLASYKQVVSDEITATNGRIDNLSGEFASFKTGEFENLKSNYGEFEKLVSEEIQATNAELENVKANSITTETLSAEIAKIGVLTADEADLKYASVDNLEALSGKFDDLSAKSITTDNLSAETAKLGYLNADVADLKYAKVETLETDYLKLQDLSAETAKLGYATIDSLNAVDAKFDNLNTKYASVDLANIDTANIDKAKVATLFAEMGLISTAVIEEGHVTGYLDSVSINANSIKAGTLSVDRLIINGSEQSLIYALNNAGELTSTSVDTLDGGLLTDRTITADKLVAHSITANEITTSNIVGASGWINLAEGTFNYGNQLIWDGTELAIAASAITMVTDGKYASKSEEERLTDAITRITANESSIKLLVSTQESFSGRLTTTESQISVLQENIDLRVKYTDLDAYSTTAQMEAAINLSANSITQTVSETYTTKKEFNDLEIGGRNLARNTSSEWTEWFTPAKDKNNSSFEHFDIYPGDKKIGDVFTVSFDIEVNKFTTGVGGTFTIYVQGSVDDVWSIINPFAGKYVFTDKALAGNYTEHVSYLCTITSEDQVTATKFNFGTRCNYSDGTGSYRIKNLKVERGNKATDWTPAPEDTETSISEAKTVATQTADKFNWLVASGDSSTNFTLTDRMATLIADTISLNGNVKVSGDMLVDGSVTASKIDVVDLFAQDITASGSITGVSLNGATGTFTGDVTATNLIATQSGRIGGFDIGSKYLANNTATLCSVANSVYIGTDGISCGDRFKVTPDGIARLYCTVDSSGTATQDASFIVQNPSGTVFTTLTPNSVYVYNSGSYASIGCGGMAFVTGGSSLWYQIDSSNLFYSGNYVTNSHCGSWLNGATGAVAAIRIDQVGHSNGVNWLASIKSPSGAWAMGVYNYESDGTFCLTYVSDDLINASTNTITTYTRIRPDGQILAHNSITVGNYSVSNEYQYNVINSLRNGRFVVSNVGNLGIYDTTNSAWLLQSSTDRSVVLTGNTCVRLVASGYAVQFGTGFTSGTVSFTPRTTSGEAADAKIVLGASSSRWTTCFAKNGTSTSSDERDKNISCLDKRYKDLFMKIEPIIYTWNDEEDETKHIGIGAQSFEKAAHECGLSTEEVGAIRHDYWMEPNENGRTDRYSINYDEVVMLAVPFVQNHEHRLTDTESQIEILQYRLDQAYDEIAKLKQQLAS